MERVDVWRLFCIHLYTSNHATTKSNNELKNKYSNNKKIKPNLFIMSELVDSSGDKHKMPLAIANHDRRGRQHTTVALTNTASIAERQRGRLGALRDGIQQQHNATQSPPLNTTSQRNTQMPYRPFFHVSSVASPCGNSSTLNHKPNVYCLSRE